MVSSGPLLVDWRLYFSSQALGHGPCEWHINFDTVLDIEFPIVIVNMIMFLHGSQFAGSTSA